MCLCVRVRRAGRGAGRGQPTGGGCRVLVHRIVTDKEEIYLAVKIEEGDISKVGERRVVGFLIAFSTNTGNGSNNNNKGA